MRHRPALVALAVLALLVVAGTWVIAERHYGFPGDLRVEQLRLHHAGATALLERPSYAIGLLGQPEVAIATVATLAFVASRWLGTRFAVLVLAASGVVVASTLLKQVLGPSSLQRMLHYDVASFPSGHTAYATALFGLLAVLAWAARRWLVMWLSLGIVAAMGPARVAVGAHWVSDVVGGYGLGVAWLACVLVAGIPWSNSKHRKPA